MLSVFVVKKAEVFGDQFLQFARKLLMRGILADEWTTITCFSTLTNSFATTNFFPFVPTTFSRFIRWLLVVGYWLLVVGC